MHKCYKLRWIEVTRVAALALVVAWWRRTGTADECGSSHECPAAETRSETHPSAAGPSQCRSILYLTEWRRQNSFRDTAAKLNRQQYFAERLLTLRLAAIQIHR